MKFLILVECVFHSQFFANRSQLLPANLLQTNDTLKDDTVETLTINMPKETKYSLAKRCISFHPLIRVMWADSAGYKFPKTGRTNHFEATLRTTF